MKNDSNHAVAMKELTEMTRATRRGFLRVTSLGAAAAAGVLGGLPALAFAEGPLAAAPASGMPAAQPIAPAAAPVVGEAYAAPFVVYVNSPQVGQAVIYVGEREIPISDPAIVQYLREAAVSG